jgi:hypothetical protein
MNLKQTSKGFRGFFLMKFTEELIKNSKPISAIELENALRDTVKRKLTGMKNQEELINIISPEISSSSPPRALKESGKTFDLDQMAQPQIPIKLINPLPVGNISIPQQQLPPTVQYITPVPGQKTIDLGKLNPFIRDPTVTSIECHGPGKQITVKRPGEFTPRTTAIILTKPEIQKIIQSFSEAAKIPPNEGVFRVAVGTLMISAIIPQSGTGSTPKFIISKILYGR